MVYFSNDISVTGYFDAELFSEYYDGKGIRNGLSNDCIAWLKQIDGNDLEFFLANWMQLPSNLNEVDDFSNLVFSTIHYFSRIYQKQIFSLHESFVLAIEGYSWPGGYLEWFQLISQVVSKNQTGHLALNDLPIGMLEKIIYDSGNKDERIGFYK